MVMHSLGIQPLLLSPVEAEIHRFRHASESLARFSDRYLARYITLKRWRLEKSPLARSHWLRSRVG